METKLHCILFLFLILLAFSPEPEAHLNTAGKSVRRRTSRKDGGIFQKKAALWVSRFIATCLPYLLIAIVSHIYPVYYCARFVQVVNVIQRATIVLSS